MKLYSGDFRSQDRERRYLCLFWHVDYCVAHKHLPRYFFISIEVPLFQHSLTRDSKDWRTSTFVTRRFVRLTFFRGGGGGTPYNVLHGRKTLLEKLRFASLLRKSSKQSSRDCLIRIRVIFGERRFNFPHKITKVKPQIAHVLSTFSAAFGNLHFSPK